MFRDVNVKFAWATSDPLREDDVRQTGRLQKHTEEDSTKCHRLRELWTGILSGCLSKIVAILLLKAINYLDTSEFLHSNILYENVKEDMFASRDRFAINYKQYKSIKRFLWF